MSTKATTVPAPQSSYGIVKEIVQDVYETPADLKKKVQEWYASVMGTVEIISCKYGVKYLDTKGVRPQYRNCVRFVYKNTSTSEDSEESGEGGNPTGGTTENESGGGSESGGTTTGGSLDGNDNDG